MMRGTGRANLWTRVTAVTSSLVVITSLVQAHPVWAQAKPAAPTAKPGGSGTAEARTHYAEGEKRLKANDYAAALTEFEAADQLRPSPQAARSIGLCEDNLEHYPQAVSAYERFLADVPPKMNAQADEVRTRLAAIKALPAKIHLDSDPKGAAVMVDGKAQATPAPMDIEVPPGRHTLKAAVDGYDDQTQEVDVTFASKTDLTLKLTAKPAVVAPPVALSAPPPEPIPPPVVAVAPEEPRSKLPAYITGGIAIAAAGVGTVFGIVALGDKSDFDKNPTSGKADDGENHALIADMAFGVAITLGITSAVLFFTKDEPATPAAPAAPAAASGERPATVTIAHRAERPKVTFSAAPIVTPHGGGAGALFRF